MKFVFAPDSFKGSLSANKVCKLLTKVATRYYETAEIDSIPVADGGEGTVEALIASTKGRKESVIVTDPMGRLTKAIYGILGDCETAVIEMAQTSGLPLVSRNERNPLSASSYGTGEMIAHVLQKGYRKLLIGLGGSATNDGGMGVLSALGARFFDRGGRVLRGSGGELECVDKVDMSGLIPSLRETEIIVLSDVSNTLLGENGATIVYGPQKGATGSVIDRLEAGMVHYANVMRETTGESISDIAGSGAAGGMGAAFAGVLKAPIRPGISTILDIVDFDGRIRGASLVITGEGRIDGQSIRYGKVVAGVAKRCAMQNVPVIAIAGGMTEDADGLYSLAESSIMTTTNGIMDIEYAMENAEDLFLSAADRMFRMLRIGSKM